MPFFLMSPLNSCQAELSESKLKQNFLAFSNNIILMNSDENIYPENQATCFKYFDLKYISKSYCNM